MKKLFPTILVLSLLLIGNVSAGIFDLFQSSTSKCIKKLRKHSLIERYETLDTYIVFVKVRMLNFVIKNIMVNK